MDLLVRSDIGKACKMELRDLLAYFADVADIDPSTMGLHARLDRSNQAYRTPMNMC